VTVVAAPRPKRWTKAEYRQLLDRSGADRLRYELIDGEIIEMPPQTDVHSYALSLADYAARKVFRKGFVVKIQSPLDLSHSSEPEPDLMVVKGEVRSLRKHPKSAELIIEVAWGSLQYDRETKGSLYASKGILEYWIVNLHDNVVEVRRRPVKDAAAQFGYSYAETEILKRGDSVRPLAAPKSRVAVTDLLP
jgi:Uma2 family endonuclease